MSPLETRYGTDRAAIGSDVTHLVTDPERLLQPPASERAMTSVKVAIAPAGATAPLRRNDTEFPIHEFTQRFKLVWTLSDPLSISERGNCRFLQLLSHRRSLYSVMPTYAMNVNDPVNGDVAKHVRFAHDNPNDTMPPGPDGKPKVIPRRNERLVDPALQDAQRRASRAACDKWLEPAPTDHDCDEFPPAATYQGSLTADPDSHFSVRWIHQTPNRSEGATRRVWYRDDRILDKDAYWVVAYDGPTG